MANHTQELQSLPAPHVAAWAESICVDGVTDFLAYTWEPETTIAVVGLGQDVNRELHLEHLQADGIQLMRRASGGGAVILHSGVLCFGMIAPPQALGGQYDIHAAFAKLCGPVLSVLQGVGVKAKPAGISDIAVELTPEGKSEPELRKIAGCAQLRKKHAILVHGSLLVNADISSFSRYLRFPSKVPDYRNSRSHEDFCCNLNAVLPRPVDVMELSVLLRQEVNALGWFWQEVPMALSPAASALMRDKYLNQEWNFYRKR